MADEIDPRDPKLAEALNPRLALARRMAQEGQQPAPMPDTRVPPGQPARFTKQWTPEEQAQQKAALARLLMNRQ